MTILGALMGDRRSLNGTRPLTSASLLDVLGGSPTDSGISVSPEVAFRLTAVYRCIAILAGLVGALPLHSYRRSTTGVVALPSVMDNPHPDMTSFEVREFVGQSLLSWGNGFAYKQRDGMGHIRELEPLHPRNVHVERRTSWKGDANPSGKRFEVHDGASLKTYTAHDIWHVPGLSYDGVVGMSPISVARQAIGLGLAAEAFGARMFGRGALVPGVLQTDQQIDQPRAQRLKDQWRAKAAGPDNQWDIPILDSGSKFVPIGLPPEDVQMLQTREFAVVEIARLYGLPPHLVGAVERSTSWGTGIEQQNMQMLTFTADPWLVRIEQRATKELILDGSRYFRFKRQALLRADTAARFMAYQRGINNGWLNADEIRALEEMEPLPDGEGQAFFRPANLVPLTADDGGVA